MVHKVEDLCLTGILCFNCAGHARFILILANVNCEVSIKIVTVDQ